MTPLASARKALRLAIEKRDGDPEFVHGNDVLAVAYMRLLVARRTRSGVRLSSEEVEALFELDSAIILAAENIEAEFVPAEEEEWTKD